MSAHLEEEIDGLYAGPLDEFVTERNAVARKLKQAGDRDAAAEVAGLRKPTLVAWTVNQLARTQRRDVDLLLDAGKRIVDAQETSISEGGRAGLDAARASLRTAVTGLTASAQRLLGERGNQSTLTRVAETLRSAATEEKGRELLARGRLTAELSDTGWDTIAALAPGRAPERATRTDTKRRESRARLKAARDAVRREESAHTAAATRLQKATTEAERLRDRLEAAESAVEEAQAEVAAAEQRLTEAEQERRRLDNR